MRFWVDYLKSIFLGFVVTPVFFVSISVLSYSLHYYLIFSGKPISIHEVALWLLLLVDRTRGQIEFWSVVISWILGWLLVLSRSRNFPAVIFALITAYFLYILYLVSFWRISIILEFPYNFYQLLITMAVLVVVKAINRVRPKKTIFDILARHGMIFPEEWRRPVELPMRCPHCGAVIHSSSDICWSCGRRIFRGEVE